MLNMKNQYVEIWKMWEISSFSTWQDFYIYLHFCPVDKVSALVSALLLSKTAGKHYSIRKIWLKMYLLQNLTFCND